MRRFIFLSLVSLSLHATTTGETLFNGNCLTCHAIEKANSAPAIQEVQRKYKNLFHSKDEFVNFMTQWVEKPNSKTALMPEAIKKYGLMPELGYDRETLREIATYLYDTTIHP